MRSALFILIAAVIGTLDACNLDITNPNAPTQSLRGDP